VRKKQHQEKTKCSNYYISLDALCYALLPSQF